MSRRMNTTCHPCKVVRMDADRRGKTVIAGTFAIARKSLSNAQPISADEIASHHQVDMIITSMHAPSLHPAQAGAEGIYARNQAGPRYRNSDLGQPISESRGGPLILEIFFRRAEGQIRSWPRALAFAPRQSASTARWRTPRPFFVSVRIFEVS